MGVGLAKGEKCGGVAVSALGASRRLETTAIQKWY